MIEKNISEIKKNLNNRAELLVVSKFRSKEEIKEAYQTGQRKFAENRVQNILERYSELPKDIEWHLIGHLQTNKVKFIAPFIHTIQSVDSIKLMLEIEKQAQKENRIIEIYLQIFIAKEDTKFGLSFEEAEECLYYYLNNKLQNVKISGFMAMATNTNDKNIIEAEYKSLYQWIILIKEKFKEINFKNFSYGMSNDFEIAINNGSNMVRIGTSVFE